MDYTIIAWMVLITNLSFEPSRGYEYFNFNIDAIKIKYESVRLNAYTRYWHSSLHSFFNLTSRQ